MPYMGKKPYHSGGNAPAGKYLFWWLVMLAVLTYGFVKLMEANPDWFK